MSLTYNKFKFLGFITLTTLGYCPTRFIEVFRFWMPNIMTIWTNLLNNDVHITVCNCILSIKKKSCKYLTLFPPQGCLHVNNIHTSFPNLKFFFHISKMNNKVPFNREAPLNGNSYLCWSTCKSGPAAETHKPDITSDYRARRSIYSHLSLRMLDGKIVAEPARAARPLRVVHPANA